MLVGLHGKAASKHSKTSGQNILIYENIPKTT